MFVKVIFFLPMRKSFTYSVPETLENDVAFGKRVVVPFANRVLTGIIIEIVKTISDDFEVKDIYDVIDKIPVITETHFVFARWLSEYYLCSLGDALRLSIPHSADIETKRTIISDIQFCANLYEKEKKKNSIKARLLKELSKKENHTIKSLQKSVNKKNIYSQLHSLEKEGAISILDVIEKPRVKIRTQKYVKLIASKEDISIYVSELEKKAPKQALLLIYLSNIGGEISLAELQKQANVSAASVKSMEGKGIVKIYDKEIERIYKETYSESKKELIPNKEQKEVINSVTEFLSKNRFQVFLLHGVTGSGKTQVYIELSSKALNAGKNVMILVPEISLTPQITMRFHNRFEGKVAVFHSRMSVGERYDVWRGVLSGKYNIVIGPRSALFVPLKNIGLIIVDEEHDSSYKQYDKIPRYNARDAAIMLGSFSEAPVLLGSATPSLESMFNAELGKYKLLKMQTRADTAQMPIIKLINLNAERKSKRLEGTISKTLLDEIAKKISKNEGVIILQNRRGFATNVFCEDCGNIEMCPNCSVSLVYHVATNEMRCHYCGFKKEVPKSCPVCGSENISFYGTGIQKVEDELNFYFPDAVIKRVDSDSISRKGELGLLLNKFASGEIDILIGTQMVSKGLDISNVTLVGVVSAEATLWLPDFRADERTFQLLTQVAGRSGRATKKGEVLIQTENVSHFVLQQVLRNDYETFYGRELNLRKEGAYPPFTRLALIETKSENQISAKRAIKNFHNFLTEVGEHIQVLPPNEAVLAKLKGEYRYQILIKSFKSVDPAGKILHKAIKDALSLYTARSKFSNVKLIIDIDPISVL